jgi:hypothetical protein
MRFDFKLLTIATVDNKPTAMKPNHHIQTELQELAPLLGGIDRAMPHALPEGYFETLPLLLLSQVQQLAAKQEVPQGYFDQLPHLLLQKVRHNEVFAELEAIAPLLNTIDKQPVAYVPEGYFDSLAQRPAMARPKVGLVRQWVGRAMPYAAAACLALVIWIGAGWQGNEVEENAFAASDTSIESALRQIDEQAIASFLQHSSAVDSYTSLETVSGEIEPVLKGLQTEVLENYIKNMPTLVPNEHTDM